MPETFVARTTRQLRVLVSSSYASSPVGTILLIALATGIAAFILIAILPILLRLIIGIAVIALGIYALILIIRVLRR